MKDDDQLRLEDGCLLLAGSQRPEEMNEALKMRMADISRTDMDENEVLLRNNK